MRCLSVRLIGSVFKLTARFSRTKRLSNYSLLKILMKLPVKIVKFLKVGYFKTIFHFRCRISVHYFDLTRSTFLRTRRNVRPTTFCIRIFWCPALLDVHFRVSDFRTGVCYRLLFAQGLFGKRPTVNLSCFLFLNEPVQGIVSEK